jgi:hypothetical protein
MNKRLAIILSILVVMMMACNLATNTGSNPQVSGNTPQVGGNQPGGTPPANPVSINDGLGSLNSYQMTVIIKSVGPDPTQSSSTTIEIQRSRDTDATYTHLTMLSVPKGGGDPNNTDTNIYRIGNDQCSGSADNWTWTSNSPAQTEMQAVTKSMFGLTPLIESPTFVSQETVNGIPSNHFTFKVSGLGVKSGVQVNINQGDYWLAVDGQYIVKYILILETSEAANAKILHEEVSIELNQINQPVNIAFPQTCLDASTKTP